MIALPPVSSGLEKLSEAHPSQKGPHCHTGFWGPGKEVEWPRLVVTSSRRGDRQDVIKKTNLPKSPLLKSYHFCLFHVVRRGWDFCTFTGISSKNKPSNNILSAMISPRPFFLLGLFFRNPLSLRKQKRHNSHIRMFFPPPPPRSTLILTPLAPCPSLGSSFSCSALIRSFEYNNTLIVSDNSQSILC